MKVFNFIMQIEFGTVVFVCIYHISHKSEKIGKKIFTLGVLFNKYSFH